MKLFTTLTWLASLQPIHAIDVDWESTASIKAAARIAADGMMSYYTGNLPGQIPGLLPQPYYWWEAGAMFGALVDYYHYTGDDHFNALTMQAMTFQVGEHDDYAPQNQTSSLGNDDQSFWAMAAMRAVETNFPNPPAGKPSWLALVQAVFNEQVGRWDTVFCNGGIRWQIPQLNRGYDLKNTISNGNLFHLAARLARYTGDPKYADWAEKIWDWMWRIGLVDNGNYNVYDNSEADENNCSRIDRHQWTYNAATMLMGSATMFNYTNASPSWQNRTASLLSTLAFDFFPSGIAKEICEENNVCNTDQKSFKAYLARWLAASIQMAPFTYNTSYPLLLSSAKAAAAQCTGSPSGSVCGLKWTNNGTWDGTNGVGQQMAVLEVLLGTLIRDGSVKAPVTNSTGGTSVGNPNAGFNSSQGPPLGAFIFKATKGGKAGAWIFTVVLTGLVWGALVWMGTGVFEGREEGQGWADGRVAGWREKGLEMGGWKGKERGGDLGAEGIEDIDVVNKGKGVELVPVSAIADARGLVAGDNWGTPVFRGGDLRT